MSTIAWIVDIGLLEGDVECEWLVEEAVWEWLWILGKNIGFVSIRGSGG